LFPERHIYDPPEEIFGMHWGKGFHRHMNLVNF
jgi:hypothetical protein